MYTQAELDNMCDDRVMAGVFNCIGCPGDKQCTGEAKAIVERRGDKWPA